MSTSRPARLSVGVVSAGRVGAVVGAAWAAAGHHVVAASGVSRESVRRAAALLPDVPLRAPDEVVRGVDLALLAVPDDVLPGLVRGLAAAGCFRPGQIVVHTSGARGVARAGPGDRARRAAAGPAPGDDVHRPGRGRRPAGRAQRRGHRDRRRRGRLERGGGAGASRWAPSRCASTRRSARSTTPRSRTAPTT